MWELLTMNKNPSNEKSDVCISDIKQIFTDNDFVRFQKKSDNCSQYVITENSFSENDILFQESGYNDSQQVIERVKNILSLGKNHYKSNEIAGENLGRQGINQWLIENFVNEEGTSKPIKRFLLSKKYLDPWTYFFLINLVKRIVKLAAFRSGKKIVDLTRSDLGNEKIYHELLTEFNSKNEIAYLNIFMREFSTFEPIELVKALTKQKAEPLNHPLVNFYVKELRKKGTKEQSIKNNHILNLRRFFTWLCSVREEHKNSSMNNILVHHITSEQLNDYKGYLVKQVKDEFLTELGAKRHLQYVKSFFLFLYQKKKILKDVSFNLSNINADEYLYRKMPSSEEIEDFMNVVATYSDEPIKERLAFMLMLQLGLRGSEVANLKWEDLNIGNATIAINDSKGVNTLLPLPTFLNEDFKKIGMNLKGFVFSKQPTTFKSNLYRNFKLYSLIAGWEYKGGLHLLRHTCITRLSKTCPIQLLPLISRHKSDSTTAKYIHLDPTELRNELNKLRY
jgi:integrase